MVIGKQPSFLNNNAPPFIDLLPGLRQHTVRESQLSQTWLDTFQMEAGMACTCLTAIVGFLFRYCTADIWRTNVVDSLSPDPSSLIQSGISSVEIFYSRFDLGPGDVLYVYAGYIFPSS